VRSERPTFPNDLASELGYPQVITREGKVIRVDRDGKAILEAGPGAAGPLGLTWLGGVSGIAQQWPFALG